MPLLQRTELRRFLTDAQLQELERYCRAIVRKAGTTVFRQDQDANALFVLVEGTIELRARPPGRRVYRTVELVRPACTFGDEALVDRERYLSSARTLEQSRILSLSRSSFDRLIDVRPDIAAGIIRTSARCLLRTIQRAAILIQAPAEVALRILLNDLAEEGRQNGPAPVRITHAQLAGVLHLSRETVSRMLGQMAAEGRVELGRGVIRLRRI